MYQNIDTRQIPGTAASPMIPTNPEDLVPGTTAGPNSPGTAAYPAGSPAPIFFGAQLPVGQVPTQTYPTATQPIAQASSEYVVAPGSPGLSTDNILYIPGYLKTLIGRRIRVEFLIGEANFQDRIGTLLAVGTDYIVIREVDTDDELLCDMYSIKFVYEYK